MALQYLHKIPLHFSYRITDTFCQAYIVHFPLSQTLAFILFGVGMEKCTLGRTSNLSRQVFENGPKIMGTDCYEAEYQTTFAS